jgi:hypothetical protein
MKLKETIAITIGALAFLLITGIAKSDEQKTITPQEFVSNVVEVPNKVGTWFNGEVKKTKEYQAKSWAKTKEDFASLVKKFGLLGEKDESQN